MLKKNSEALGLDIGAYSTKAVHVRRQGGRAEICAADTYNTSEEGILNETELLQSVRQWIGQHGWNSLATAVALPQYLVTTMIRSFPATGKNNALDSMVSYEIGQVAGLSDESILHDHCTIESVGGNCRVLIGMCREQVSRDKLSLLESAGLRADTIAVGGIAVANAFLELNPNVKNDSKVRLLIDLGHENSTAVVMRGAKPLFTGVLMFSGVKFEQACAGDDRPNALKAKSVKEINIEEEIGHSTILMAARLLENEIHGVVETWRAQENDETSKAIVEEVHICGGVSLIKGLGKWLEERLETPVNVFGPMVDGVTRPDLALAYGLAVQSLGCAALPLTIVPADVREERIRRKGWPLLATAVGVAVACMVVLDVVWYMRVNGRINYYENKLSGLQNCNEQINRIEAAYGELYSREANMIPLVASGTQAEHLKDALAAIGSACAEGDWFIYLADEHSYMRQDEKEKAKPREKRTDMFGGKDDAGEIAGQAEFPLKMSPRDVPVTQAYVAMSFSPNQENQPFAPAKEIAAKLNATGLFSGVDLMADKEHAGRGDIYRPWARFLSGVRGQYRPYSFLLPFAEADVRKDVLPEIKEKGGRK
ncbi:MAG: pilus assembly protein PilM [Victivallales bacterium]|nr:pilus assembly protein PilM [Victivallales bacterium]